MDEITKLVQRLERVGVKIELAGSLPCVYLASINGKPVKEHLSSEHGYTICYVTDSGNVIWTNTKLICLLYTSDAADDTR